MRQRKHICNNTRGMGLHLGKERTRIADNVSVGSVRAPLDGPA